MLQQMSRSDRMRLLKFVCSFAWADLEVGAQERTFVMGLTHGLGMDEDECKQVKGWLDTPPKAEEVDPTDIPTEHRAQFLAAAKALVEQDGVVTDDEAVNLALFEQLME